MTEITTDTSASKPAPLIPLLGAFIYDVAILLGLLMLTGFIAVGVHKVLTGQDAIAAGSGWFLAYNLLVVYGYVAGFWLSKQQTVGMRVWRLHLTTTDEKPLTGLHCTLRFLMAIPAWSLLMIGVLWRYGHPKRYSWQDHVSHTTVLYTPKLKTR